MKIRISSKARDVPKGLLEFSLATIFEASRFIAVRNSLKNLVQVGKNLVVTADFQSTAHGDIYGASESLFEKLGEARNLEQPDVRVGIEFERDIHVGFRHVIATCDGTE